MNSSLTQARGDRHFTSSSGGSEGGDELGALEERRAVWPAVGPEEP